MIHLKDFPPFVKNVARFGTSLGLIFTLNTFEKRSNLIEENLLLLGAMFFLFFFFFPFFKKKKKKKKKTFRKGFSVWEQQPKVEIFVWASARQNQP